jgi:hypothetical protein
MTSAGADGRTHSACPSRAQRSHSYEAVIPRAHLPSDQGLRLVYEWVSQLTTLTLIRRAGQLRVGSSTASLRHLWPLIRLFVLERTTGLEPATLTLATRTGLPLSSAGSYICPDHMVVLVRLCPAGYGPCAVDWARNGHDEHLWWRDPDNRSSFYASAGCCL